MLYIDPRKGSDKLLKEFEGDCESTMLEAGDVAFFGNGPGNQQWYIGMEYKTVEDAVGSMKSGRITGTQLPGMLRLYDISFFIIEGITIMDQYGQLAKKWGKASFGMGLPFSGWDNFQTSIAVHSALAGKPCIVKRTPNLRETVQIIKDAYTWFQKPWEEHSNISRPDTTKMQRVAYELETMKISPGSDMYPKYLLRKMLFQVEHMGWKAAGHIADHFGTMEALMAASIADFAGVKSVGDTMAKRIYLSLHGHADPTVKIRRKKGALQD